MSRQQGFGAIAAIVVIVILAGLSAAIVSVGTGQQMTIAQDLQSARAWQAARSGTEWGLYQALQAPTLPVPGTGIWAVGAASDLCPATNAKCPGTSCPGPNCDSSCLGHDPARDGSATFAVNDGFSVTVTGTCTRYYEGEDSPGTPHVTLVYRIQATACPVAAGCPAAGSVASPGYVERSRSVVATN